MRSVFDLHEEVMRDYEKFFFSYLRINDQRVREFVETELREKKRLWPEPLIQLSPAYRRAGSIEDLAREGLVEPETAEIFRHPSSGRPHNLYQHQREAVERAREGKSFVVTSGTGSGKSFCYFIPIVDAVLRRPQARRPLALIVYPMNALANSQLEELRSLDKAYRERTGKEFPVTYARYTGETSEEERQKIRENPPHILMTNYMMLELMMVRAEDRPLFQSSSETPVDDDAPFFLVFDELHTYRGRQGADVAFLIRRLRARFARKNVIHIGTSATMVAHRQATPAEERRVVADFATNFFGWPIDPTKGVIVETLEAVTQGGNPGKEELAESFDMPLPDEPEKFCRHPLGRWVEHAFGIIEESGGILRRRTPRTLTDAARELSTICERSEEECRRKLQEVLLRGAVLRGALGRNLFSFKLHQFISQGQWVYATLEPPDKREFTLEPRLLTGENSKRWLPLCFCRQCGHEYYRVREEDNCFVAPDEENRREVSYLTFVSPDHQVIDDILPEEWLGDNGKPSATWKDRIPQKVWVLPDGSYSRIPKEGAMPMWRQVGGFYLCVHCRESYDDRKREYAKLASLSSEGRSSATTVLALSFLRHAKRSNDDINRDTNATGINPKLLTFTDNRQDASLQAGHFNDFVQVLYVRGGLYQALAKDGQLNSGNVARRVVEEMGLPLSAYAKSADLDPDSYEGQKVKDAFTDLIEYRVYEDLAREWRVSVPNLEDVGLLEIAYEGLESLCEDESFFGEGLEKLRQLSSDDRCRVLRNFLERFRKKLSINAPLLKKRERQKELINNVELRLNDYWGFEPGQLGERELRRAPAFVRPTQGKRRHPKEEYKITASSALGKLVRESLKLHSPQECEKVLERLLELLCQQGFLEREGSSYWLNAGVLVWRLGKAAATPCQRGEFFRDLYTRGIDLQGYEAREHTAQVVAPGERERRERRFRGEEEPPLCYLVCSPTMELGINIAELDVVHMRNVPPTPANYAQRSGRAGRQGNPGLVFVYCAANSYHDQFFFKHREDMVAGSVRAPRLDLENKALRRQHIHAEWLAELRLPLSKSLSQVIDLDKESLPLCDNVRASLKLPDAKRAELIKRLEKVFVEDCAEGSPEELIEWLSEVVNASPVDFNAAFDRWRKLYKSVQLQLSKGQSLQRSRDTTEQEQGNRIVKEAQRQQNLLLQQDVSPEESDFYPYRYLASEGFLPGYNFPALPVRAWVPRGERGEFISRPRFVAVTELAPRNLVYHEGLTWEVAGFLEGNLSDRFMTIKTCTCCGAYETPEHDRCPLCDSLWDPQTSSFHELLEMPNVRLKRLRRITCNDEERLRSGFLGFFTYRFDKREAHRAIVRDRLTLEYAPSAEIMIVNAGWEVEGAKGFAVKLSTGEVPRKEATKGGNEILTKGDSSDIKTVELAVKDYQNLLRLHLLDAKLRNDQTFETTLKYALERSFEHMFQLEDAELKAECVGTDENRMLIFYETAEGGAGALKRLIELPDALAEAAREALRLLHFDPETGDDCAGDAHRACYECLLNFSNQREARFLDRHAVKDFLLGLTGCIVEQQYAKRSRKEHYEWLLSRIDPNSQLEKRLLEYLYQYGHKLPDECQYGLPEPRCVVDFFYKPNVCVFCDGSVHDALYQQKRDQEIRSALQVRGLRVIAIRYDSDLQEQIAKYPEVFGEGKRGCRTE